RRAHHAHRRPALHCLHPVWRTLVSIGLDEILGLCEFGLFFLEEAEAEPSYGLRGFVLPHRHILANRIVLRDYHSSPSLLHALCKAKSHVIKRKQTHVPYRVVGIP